MADSTNKHLRWLFPLCFIAGILIGGALSLSQGDPEPAMRRSLPPAIVHDLNYHPPFPDHLRTAFSECTQLLKQTDPESIDKAELIALVQELAVAKQDLLSPILNQLLQVLGSDREFRTAAYDWAMEHPAAAMQFCLDFEGAPHQIVGSIKSAALGMRGGARLFIEHVNSATNLNGVSPSDVKVALWSLKGSGLDIIAEINSLPKELRDEQYYYELWSRSETDPAAAFHLAISDPDMAAGSKQAAFWILQGLFIQAPKMADNFLDRVPEALKKDYAFNGVPALVGAGMTDKALQLASQLLSPEGAEQFGTNPTKVFQYLSNNYVSSGIGTANLVDWLQKLPTPELRASGEAEFMKVIIKEDPGSAIPWLQSSESGDTRDGYLAQLLDDLPTDHENYEQMLDLIENPEMRTAAEEAAASRPRFDLPSDED